jgi:hypothetical protein
MTVTDSAGAWQRVLSLFHQALDRKSSGDPLCSSRCGGRIPALADELQSSLRRTRMRDRCPARISSAGGAPGRIGPYRLVEMLVSAGWAWSTGPSARPTTSPAGGLKLIRGRLCRSAARGGSNASAASWPVGASRIARFIDGVPPDTSQSFFAMEFVEA